MAKNYGGNRSLLLETARQMFNEQGTGPSSTNHIAKAAGVSPGNLYYHFRNKKEIIRELYRGQTEEFGHLWKVLRPGRTLFLRIIDNIYEGFGITWRYRFIAREMASLMQSDPWLKEAHREVYQTRSVLILPMIAKAQRDGLIHITDDDHLVDDMNRLVWMVSYYWISFLDLEGKEATKERRGEMTRLCLRAFEPYLAEEVRNEVLEYLRELEGR